MKIINKIIKVLAYIVVGVILLNVLLFAVFSLPPVQKAAANFALGKLKPIIKTEASLDKIRIRLFNTVVLGGVYIESQQGDTLLYARNIAVRANFLDILHNKLDFETAELEDFVIDISRENPDKPFNFQFLIDAFSSDKPKEDKPKKPFGLSFRNIRLSGGDLRYNILSKPETPGLFNVDHIRVNNLNLSASAPSVDIKKLDAKIHSFSFAESSGIEVRELKGNFKSKGSKIWGDDMKLVVNQSEFVVDLAEYDLDTKETRLKANSDLINPKDIAIFVPQASSLDKPFSFDVQASGKIPSIEIRNFHFRYGDDTEANLTGSFSDIEHYADAEMNLRIEKMKLNIKDLESFIRIGSADFVAPKQMTAFKEVSLDFNASGRFSNFGYEGVMSSSLGSVRLSGKGMFGRDFKYYEISGPVSADDIQLSAILGPEIGLGDATLRANMQLEGGDNKLKITADGNLISLLYKKYQYTNVNFAVDYDDNKIFAQISTDEEHNKFDLTADIGFGEQMMFQVDGIIDRLFLSPIFQMRDWQNPYMAARIEGKMSGATIDDLQGSLRIDSVSLYDDNFIYNPGEIFLEAVTSDSVGQKKISFASSFLDAQIVGDYHFATIADQLIKVLQPHLPTLIELPNSKKTPTQTELVNNFNFNIHIKNTEDLSYAFSLPIYNVEPATLNGSIDFESDTPLKMNAYLPRLMMGNSDIRESKINLQNSASEGINLDVNTFLVQNDGYINARLNTSAISDSLINTLFFDIENSVAKANGTLKIDAGLQKDQNDALSAIIHILPTQILFNQQVFDMHDATIAYTKDRITIEDFGMSQNEMLLIGLEGTASRKEDDRIRLYFNDTELAVILSALNIQNINGMLNGEIDVFRALQDPILQTNNFRVDSVRLYGDVIGNLRINGDLNSEKSGLSVNAFLENQGFKYIDIRGFVPMEDKNPMNIDFEMQSLPLKWIQPFTVGAFSNLSGTINSKITVSGKTSEPEIEGWLGVDKGAMQIAFTNVTYRISDTIQINRNNIGLNDLVILDDNGHTAKLDLSLSHTNFGNMMYQVRMQLNDFLLLNNTSESDMIAYGNLKMSGIININGGSNGIYGDFNLRNESKSNLTVVIPQTASASEYSGIVYINTTAKADSMAFLYKDPTKLTTINTRTTNSMPIVFRGDLQLNPQLDLGVKLSPGANDLIRINGNSNLNVLFNSKSDPPVRIFGDYIANSGNVQYNLQSLKTVDFKIEEGSTVSLVGDPLNAQFNITAYNQVKADLLTLSESFQNLPTTRVPVNAVLHIDGNLEQMNLRYDIELPEASDEVKQRVANYINTDESRTVQFAYLITSGNFNSAEGAQNTNINNSMFTSLAASAVTRGLDALFSSALNDNWTVSTNLESQDGSFESVRMGIDVSTTLFDDKLRISTNLSYGDPSNFAYQQAFIGEVDVEYRVNNWLMLRVYNHANEQLYRRAPFTQGVGVMVTKDSRTFKDLFRFSFRKKEN